MTDPTACENRIDLDALAANHAALRHEAAGAEVAPVVKADAYALGAAPVALRLWAEGARTFFVARVAEGEALRATLGERSAAVYVLDGCPPGSVARLEAAGLTPVLNSFEQIDLWRAESRRPAALHIDTGMNRLGVRAEAAEAIARLGNLAIEHVMSHLACASERDHPMNTVQAARFAEIRALFPNARASLANSAGTFMGAAYRFDMVRPGVSLYGGGPFEATHPAIATVSTVAAPILQIRETPPGETVGYGATWTAERLTRVAILAAGFADGVLRAQSPGGYGFVAGRPRPYLGRVSMDLIAIDVTGLAADHETIRLGDRVELLGPNVRLDDLARLARTVPYEILTRPAGRVIRRYVGEGE